MTDAASAQEVATRVSLYLDTLYEEALDCRISETKAAEARELIQHVRSLSDKARSEKSQICALSVELHAAREQGDIHTVSQISTEIAEAERRVYNISETAREIADSFAVLSRIDTLEDHGDDSVFFL